MDKAEEIRQAIQSRLGTHIKPRHDVARIRQILALHLDSSLQDGVATEPLALVEAKGIKLGAQNQGLQLEYLKALDVNIRARNRHEAAYRRTEKEAASSTRHDDSGTRNLEHHLTAIKLKQRHEKLRAVDKYLQLLGQKPAASPDFLDSGGIFKNSRPLPIVPKEVVDGITRDATDSKTDLEAVLNQLETHVLRAKLLLRREEQSLSDVRSRSSVVPGSVTQTAKSDALNVARDELINWIENELGKASGAGEDWTKQDSDRPQKAGVASKTRMEDQLTAIRTKYVRYLDARRNLVKLATWQPEPVILARDQGRTSEISPSTTRNPPFAHLLSPYLDTLSSVAHEQKGLITQKSHLNVTIARQLKDNSQVLVHLAEESSLLPNNPMSTEARQKLGLDVGASLTSDSEVSTRIKPWLFAADSAKMSTLEAVAGDMEKGQVALEETMRTLAEINQLLGRTEVGHPDEDGPQTTEEDVWLAEGKDSSKSPPRRHTEDTASWSGTVLDVWGLLDGNLGLLRQDDDPT